MPKAWEVGKYFCLPEDLLWIIKIRGLKMVSRSAVRFPKLYRMETQHLEWVKFSGKIWDEMLSSRANFFIIWDEILSTGMKCYHLGWHVIIWDKMLSSGMKCYNLGWNVEILSYVVIWCYHVMLSSGMITSPFLFFLKTSLTPLSADFFYWTSKQNQHSCCLTPADLQRYL